MKLYSRGPYGFWEVHTALDGPRLNQSNCELHSCYTIKCEHSLSTLINLWWQKSLSHKIIKLIKSISLQFTFRFSASLNRDFFFGGGRGEGICSTVDCVLSFLGISIRFYFPCCSLIRFQLDRRSRSEKLNRKASLSLLLGRMCSASSASCLNLNPV